MAQLGFKTAVNVVVTPGDESDRCGYGRSPTPQTNRRHTTRAACELRRQKTDPMLVLEVVRLKSTQCTVGWEQVKRVGRCLAACGMFGATHGEAAFAQVPLGLQRLRPPRVPSCETLDIVRDVVLWALRSYDDLLGTCADRLTERRDRVVCVGSRCLCFGWATPLGARSGRLVFHIEHHLVRI